MNVYVVTNLINNKRYVGAEKGNNSEYFGSGRLIKEAIEEFGKKNFKKEILIDSGHIGNWEECREFESACKLSFNTLVPSGYNIALWEYPLSVEMLRKGGKIGGKKTHESGVGIYAPENLGKGARKQKELRTGIFAPGMQSKAGKIGGGITGGIIKELRIGVCAPGIASKGGKMNAHVYFEIDGLFQQMTLGAILKI